MHDSVPLVLPVKSAEIAKERLSESLNAAQRQALSLAMLNDVLDVARTCEHIKDIWLLAANAALAKSCNTLHIPDMTGNLNSAVEDAAQYLSARGYQHICILHADLPLLEAQSLSDMIESHHQMRIRANERACVTIATDLKHQGSNAMLCSPPNALQFAYGANSLQAHIEDAKRKGVITQILELHSIATDIDSPDDLERLKEILSATQTGTKHTREFMAQFI